MRASLSIRSACGDRAVLATRGISFTGCRLPIRRQQLLMRGGRRHRRKHVVPPDERMEERRGKMQEDQGKKREGQIEMRIPEQAVQAVALRQDRRKVQAAEHHHRVGGGRQHAPADQRHGDHEGIEGPVRQMRGQLYRFGQVGRQRRRAVAQADRQANEGQHQNGDAEGFMERDEGQIFRHHAGHHADADEEHGQEAGRHHPVEEALQRGEASTGPGHGWASVAVRG